VRWFLIANSLIMPYIALQTFYHSLIWGASLRAVTLPGAAISLAVLLRRNLRDRKINGKEQIGIAIPWPNPDRGDKERKDPWNHTIPEDKEME